MTVAVVEIVADNEEDPAFAGLFCLYVVFPSPREFFTHVAIPYFTFFYLSGKCTLP